MRHRVSSWIFLALAVSNLFTAGCQNSDTAAEGLKWIEFPAADYSLGSMEEGAAYAPHTIHLDYFAMSSTETTVAEYCRYLNSTVSGRGHAHPQIVWDGNAYTPLQGKELDPIANITYAEASEYCVWLSERLGAAVRLPTEHEWEAAARGGIAGGRYPWGWGNPHGRAQFAAESACPAGSYSPNPAGVYDMAGNVFEYCLTDDSTDGKVKVRGGSWAEDNPDLLRVYRTTLVEKKYKGPDVGFRPLRISPLDRIYR